MVLDIIWNEMIEKEKNDKDERGGLNTDVLFCIFDRLEGKELLNLMEAFPAMAGLIYWSYGRRCRWKNAVQPRRDRGQAISWHQLRAEERQRREHRDAAITARKDAENARDWDTVLGQRLAERKINRRLLAVRIGDLDGQLNSVTQTQQLQADALQAVNEESPAREWNQDFARTIPIYIREEIKDLDEQAKEEAEIMNAQAASPGLQHVPPVAIPLPRSIVEQNWYEIRFKPIQRMIELDYHQALRALLRLGLFDPDGYTHDGCSHLNDAVVYNSHKCRQLLLQNCTADGLLSPPALRDASTLGPPTRPYVCSSAAHSNHISLLFGHRLIEELVAALETVHRARPHSAIAPLLLTFQKKYICTVETGRVAERLARVGINLAQETGWSNGNTTWHIAMTNPNESFFDFLQQHSPDTIDQGNHDGDPPIIVAQNLNNTDKVRWLVNRGASVYPAARRVLNVLCKPSGEPFRFYFDLAGAGLPNDPWIADVVEGLQQQINKGAEAKKDLIGRAMTLIMKLKAGNGASAASLSTLNNRNETPLEVATRYGLKEILHLLEPPTEPEGGQVHSLRHNLRKRVKRDRP